MISVTIVVLYLLSNFFDRSTDRLPFSDSQGICLISLFPLFAKDFSHCSIIEQILSWQKIAVTDRA